MRVFGVPTIRYDIKKPERQSVADPQVHNKLIYRIMPMKQQQYNYSFQNNFHPMVLAMTILK